MKRLLILLLVLTFSSCELVLFEEDLGSSDPLVNFDYLWEEVDRKYSYFELKNIDWQQVRDTYRPRLSNDTNEEELFEVMAEMLNELRDDHTNLISPFNFSRYDIALRSPENFRQRTIEEHYIPNIWFTGGLIHGFLDNDRIGYLRYTSFVTEFSDDQMDLVLNRFKDTQGMILDLRANGGGNVFNIPKILGRFTEERTQVAYSITRNGPGPNDFGEREDFFITPHDGITYLKPLIVLIDRGSYSATTFFALATKAFPHITLIGDTTGGGGGLPNGGQLPNGWNYRFSISQLLDLQGNNFSEDGVPPDIEMAFDWSDLSRDEILDRAIEKLQ